MSKSISSPRHRRAGGRGAPEIATFANAVRYLYDRVDIERMRVVRYDDKMFKLDRMRRLLRALGSPHEQIRTVHVAGTLGKGSTVAMIASILQGCGYGVGQYTSPHLVDIRERITINNQRISKSDFIQLTRQASAAAAKLPGEPTFFELFTAVAFKHFADQAVDIAVIETGLGGRLDSTNVITPEVTAITRIDYDHTHILGRTLTAIPREKAGIFKRGVPALTVEQTAEVEKVLRDAAEKLAVGLRIVNKDIEFSCRFATSDALGPHTRVCVLTETSQFMHLPVPLAGDFRPQSEQDVDLATGPFRALGARIVAQSGALAETIGFTGRLINFLPDRPGLSRADADRAWARASQGGGISAAGLSGARELFERCREDDGRFLQRCLENRHDLMISSLTRRYWDAANEPGS